MADIFQLPIFSLGHTTEICSSKTSLIDSNINHNMLGKMTLLLLLHLEKQNIFARENGSSSNDYFRGFRLFLESFVLFPTKHHCSFSTETQYIKRTAQQCIKMTTVNDSLIAVQTKLAALPKFGRLQGSTSASLKIGEILAIREKLASFSKREVALILQYVLTDYHLNKQNWL